VTSLLVDGATLYGRHASLYDVIYRNDDYYRRSAAFVVARLPPNPAILDLCAGTGTHAREFVAAGATVVGVDRSPQMLAIARTKVPQASFVCADVRELALPARFDAVVCLYGSIHYLETPDDVQAALARAYDHLVPGGVLVLELRDHDRLASEPVERKLGPISVSTRWRRGEGARGGDLYVVAITDLETGDHVVDVHHLFQTEPLRFVRLTAEAGFVDFALHAGYDAALWGPDHGGDAPVLVAKRPVN
jgi:SAM-dependent methyltransferase